MKQEIGKYNGQKAKNYYDIVRGKDEKKFGIDANVFACLKSMLPRDLTDKFVLDLGCGDGRWSEYLSRLGAKKVIGVDISQDMIQLAKQRKADKLLNNVEIILADIKSLPVANSSVDIAFTTFSLMYFENLGDVMSEISRTLKDGGNLFIATNIIDVVKGDMKEKLIGLPVPIILGNDENRILVENLAQSRNQYTDAFSYSGLIVEKEEFFEPEGVSIDDGFEHKKDLILKKAVFKLVKTNRYKDIIN